MKVLVVDDDRIFAEGLAGLLTDLGYEPTIADSCVTATEEARLGDFRIVVSDWVMPEMNGLELCRKIRADQRGRYRYFIMLTGKKSTKHRLEAIDAGVDDFLVKPVDEEELLSRLHVAERIEGYIDRIRGLESLLPVCCFCKKVQDDGGDWRDVSYYLKKEHGSQVTHGICPNCMKTQVDAIFPESADPSK